MLALKCVSGFCNTKQLGAFLLPPTTRWDASPSQGYDPKVALNLPGQREALTEEPVLPDNTTQWPYNVATARILTVT